MKMSEIAEKDITPDSGTTLRKVLKQELNAFMEDFETISGAASKASLLQDFIIFVLSTRITGKTEIT